MQKIPGISIKQIFQALPDAIIVADLEGRIQYVNPMAEHILCYTNQELMGKRLPDVVCLVDETNDKIIPCVGLSAIDSGEEQNAGTNALLIGRDGLNELPVEVKAIPLHSENQINGVILSVHDVRIERFSRKQLSWNASHDTLTGVFNRIEFNHQCHQLILSAKREESQHALLLIDIDHFRQLNELAGNHYGDELLIEVSQLLKSLLRANDHLSRNHADQFLILLSHCQLDKAELIANNLRQQIEQICLDMDHGQWPATCSIGITVIDHKCSFDINEILQQVESATYYAKRAGRNTYAVFNHQNYENDHQELAALKIAMHNHDFKLYYQTIESTQGHTPVCEILLRYHDEQGQVHEPSNFISICEKSGLIVQLDLWVIQNLLEKLVESPQLMVNFARIHVNLSAFSFSSQYFLDSIEALLANYALPPGIICFEVSESSMMKNFIHTDKFMNRLAKLGFLFAVDDLDADLVAFERLAKLPIRVAKIKGYLIQKIKNSPYGAILINAIQSMAKEANMQIVAQQVDDFVIYDWLQHHQIDYVQGFMLHPPRMLDEFAS
jgi:diguanylate cyclase (GGDEF)-like protein/PAS domain S-box-containing protein